MTPSICTTTASHAPTKGIAIVSIASALHRPTSSIAVDVGLVYVGKIGLVDIVGLRHTQRPTWPTCTAARPSARQVAGAT